MNPKVFYRYCRELVMLPQSRWVVRFGPKLEIRLMPTLGTVPELFDPVLPLLAVAIDVKGEREIYKDDPWIAADALELPSTFASRLIIASTQAKGLSSPICEERENLISALCVRTNRVPRCAN